MLLIMVSVKPVMETIMEKGRQQEILKFSGNEKAQEAKQPAEYRVVTHNNYYCI